MQIIEGKLAEQVEKELREARLESIEVFEAPNPMRPTTIEFRFSPDKFNEQQEVLEKLGYEFTAMGGCIAIPPTQEPPAIRERYEAMSPEKKRAAEEQWVKMGAAMK